jgi:hypothetical protein
MSTEAAYAQRRAEHARDHIAAALLALFEAIEATGDAGSVAVAHAAQLQALRTQLQLIRNELAKTAATLPYPSR